MLNGILQGVLSLRFTFLCAICIFGVATVAVTEGLSLIHAFEPITVRAFWTVFLILALGFLIKTGPKFPSIQRRFPFAATLILVAALSVVLTVTLVICLVSAPNTGDALCYHLSRVLHWIQDKSVENFPCKLLLEVCRYPFAEYCIANLQLLTGGDHLANFVQWSAMITGCVSASLIAEELGLSPFFQVFSALYVATIPNGILESTSTQNDYVVAGLLSVFAYFTVRVLNGYKRPAYGNTKLCLLEWFCLGSSLGLACLTKQSAVLYAIPFALALLIGACKKKYFNWRFFSCGLLALFLAISLSLGFWMRNNATFGNPLGLTNGDESNNNYVCTEITPVTVAGNLVRNATLNLATPWEYGNKIVDVAAFMALSVIGAQPNDWRTTWVGSEYKVFDPIYFEQQDGSTLHFLLSMIAVALLFTKNRTHKSAMYSFAVVAGIVLVCAIFTWTPWTVRMHLPYFVLMAPCVATVASQFLTANAVAALSLVLFAWSVPYLSYNLLRPCLTKMNIFNTSRYSQYLNQAPLYREPYEKMVDFIHRLKCPLEVAAYDQDSYFYEYVIWRMLQGVEGHDVRFQHVFIENQTTDLVLQPTFADFSPNVIICSVKPLKELDKGAIVRRNWLIYRQNIYLKQFSLPDDGLYVYVKANAKTGQPLWSAPQIANPVESFDKL